MSKNRFWTKLTAASVKAACSRQNQTQHAIVLFSCTNDVLKRIVHNVVCIWSSLCSVKGLGIDVCYYLSLQERFLQQMNSLLSPEYWCNSQVLTKFMAQICAAINPVQDHKWPILMASLLARAVSPTYSNLSPVALYRSGSAQN